MRRGVIRPYAIHVKTPQPGTATSRRVYSAREAGHPDLNGNISTPALCQMPLFSETSLPAQISVLRNVLH